MLAPNDWDPDSKTLFRTERLPTGRVVHLEISGGGSEARPRVDVVVAHRGNLQASEKSSVRESIRRMFRLDENLEQFHALCRRQGGRWRAASRGLGRLLRSPTVFEDVVKTICTTNVQWGGTRAMVAHLVDALGEMGPEADVPQPRAFPSPAAIAGAGDETLAAARLGYRAPFVRELATRVASGELDLEALLNPRMSTEEIRARLLDIKGVGSYAAATLLMLVGRYDRVAVDSVYRAFVTERYFKNGKPTPGELESVYEGWGRWQYLGYWFDLWQGTEEEV